MKKNFSLLMLIIAMVSSIPEVLGQCSGCSDFTSVLTASARKALAVQFAPELRFDNGCDTYPNFADAIFAASSNNTDCNSSSKLNQTVADDYSAENSFTTGKAHIATYYLVQNSGTRYFIDYWWAYYRQPNCIGATGGHDYDWEHIVVQLNLESGVYKKVSVTYFQHAGWYTRTFNSSYITMVGDHPVSYVGKKAHGNYHFGASCGVIECLYYGDCRNTTALRYFDVWNSNMLYEITCSNAWSAWPGQWGDTGNGPLYKVPSKFPTGYINAAACAADGSSQSNYASTVLLGNITSQKSALVNESPNVDVPFSIHPNPATNNIIVEGLSDNKKIEIYSQTGILVKSVKGQTEIDITELANGLYILKAEGNHITKFIKE
jgi:hypothetical protein